MHPNCLYSFTAVLLFYGERSGTLQLQLFSTFRHKSFWRFNKNLKRLILHARLMETACISSPLTIVGSELQQDIVLVGIQPSSHKLIIIFHKIN